MSRPLISWSIDQLEREFARAKGAADFDGLLVLWKELENRKTQRARDLAVAVGRVILERHAADARPSSSGPGPSSQGPKPTRPTRPIGVAKPSAGGGPQPRHAYPQGLKPTPEQIEALDSFRSGGSLKINAFAGTGKTATLTMLATSTSERGQYIAFNRDIVKDAKEKFPPNVNCSTTHGLAYKAMAPRFGRSNDKLTGKMNANQLAEVLKLKRWKVDKDHTLAPRSQGYLILETVKRFAQSADREPGASHVPRHGSLLAAPQSALSAVNDFAIRGAAHVWGRMQIPDDPIPLGHDGYLKLWALGDPAIYADFILLDEAQDTNPVVLDVLARQQAQMIYVGDRFQQIYEWRGAVNAMEKIATDHETLLSLSFRFGPEIAAAASSVLSLLGEKRPLRGNPSRKSRIGPVVPQTILARTNASTISAVIEALDQGRKPYLVGGKTDLMEMLKGVQDLKNGEPSTVPDFFGFAAWDEVVQFAKSGEGEHLTTFVNLVESRGERQLMWALNRTVDQEHCDLTISTAHKSKGREWQNVRLMDDFLRSRARKGERGSDGSSNGHDSAELRLFYVALTRAQMGVEIPSNLLPLVGR